MSEIITSDNLDYVVKKNREIKDEMLSQTLKFRTNISIIRNSPSALYSLVILQRFGLLQIPIEDRYLSGAIFVKNQKFVPFINTTLPRANQYFTAWHEIYHIVFDNVSFNHFINVENAVEERKAECFAANMLLDGLDKYFVDLPEMDFINKIFYCMSAFQVPYKAILIYLYEYAIDSKNELLANNIKEIFDFKFDNLPKRFRDLGLDDNLVTPSYVFNVSCLKNKISEEKTNNPDINYHLENEEYLKGIISEFNLISEKDDNENR